jgi:hypothetical protein
MGKSARGGVRRDAYTVTGPEVEHRAESGEIGLSAAITFAQHQRQETTFYVRDAAGETYGYVESDGKGGATIVRLAEARR